MSAREGDKFNIHELPSNTQISGRITSDFLERVANHTTLKEKLAKAERITGKQTMATAVLYGRNDNGNNICTDTESQIQEKIMKEKRRLAGYED
jgi:hypothetical protein